LGDAAIVVGFGVAAIIAKESEPVAAFTVIVKKPVRLEGSVAVIEVLVHELICSVCEDEEPAGVAVTLQLIHLLLKSAPVMVIVPPALTTRGMRAAEMRMVAGWIDAVLSAPEDAAVQARVRDEVRALSAAFPIYPEPVEALR